MAIDTDVQYWVTPDVVVDKTMQCVQRDIDRGKTVHVHYHKSTEDCNASCYIVKP